MTLQETLYQNTNFSIRKSTLTETWTRKTADMTDDIFQDTMLQVIENVKHYYPRYLILDFKRSSYTVSIPSQA